MMQTPGKCRRARRRPRDGGCDVWASKITRILMGGAPDLQVCPAVIGPGLRWDELPITPIFFAFTTDGHVCEAKGGCGLDVCEAT